MVKTTPATYSELQAELDGIMAQLESGNLSVDDAVTAYKRGMAVVKELEAYLKAAENTITKLKSQFGSK